MCVNVLKHSAVEGGETKFVIVSIDEPEKGSQAHATIAHATDKRKTTVLGVQKLLDAYTLVSEDTDKVLRPSPKPFEHILGAHCMQNLQHA